MQTFNLIMQELTGWVALLPIWVSGSVMAVLFITWVWLRNRRRLQYLQMDLECMRNDLRAMTTSALGMGGRVLKIEKQQRQPKYQAPVQEVKPTKPATQPKAKVVNLRPVVEDYASHPYDYAIQLARHGSSVTDIMYQSGIGENEAKLIHMLHAVEKAS